METTTEKLLEYMDDILNNAQAIRIIQTQSRTPIRYKVKADAAWQHLNAAHKAATELLQDTRIEGKLDISNLLTLDEIKYRNAVQDIKSSIETLKVKHEEAIETLVVELSKLRLGCKHRIDEDGYCRICDLDATF